MEEEKIEEGGWLFKLCEERDRLAAENAVLAGALEYYTEELPWACGPHGTAVASEALSQLSARTKAVMRVVEAAKALSDEHGFCHRRDGTAFKLYRAIRTIDADQGET